MKKLLLPCFFALGLIIASASSSNAIEFTMSNTVGKPSVIIPIQANVRLPLNLSVFGGVDIVPSYSDFVGSYKKSKGNDLWNSLVTGEANIGYNLTLIDVDILGNFNPTISPYIGYKHYFASTGSTSSILSVLNPTTSFSNVGGINYGVKFTSNLPLGFFVSLQGGAISMLNGSWTQDNASDKGNIIANGLLLPYASAGASFNLLNILTLHAGYGISYMPDIRTPSTQVKDSSLIQSLNLGLSVLFFSI